MKKIFLFLILVLSGCSTGVDLEDFHRYPERMNNWAATASMPDLCEAMEEYQEDRFVLNRILIEFRRRNVSYMNCPQYEDIMQEMNKNKRNRV